MVKLFLRGKPGVGKTTIIKSLLKVVPSTVCVSGFYTEEVREGSNRVGFDIVILDKNGKVLEKMPFARKQAGYSKFKVGKYSVFVDVVDKAVERVMDSIKKMSPSLVVIDEVGKMELLSKRFCDMVYDLLRSDFNIVGVVGWSNHKLLKWMLSNKELLILNVTKENRDVIKDQVIARFRNLF